MAELYAYTFYVLVYHPVQPGASSFFHLALLMNKIAPGEQEICIMLKLFSNTSIHWNKFVFKSKHCVKLTILKFKQTYVTGGSRVGKFDHIITLTHKNDKKSKEEHQQLEIWL